MKQLILAFIAITAMSVTSPANADFFRGSDILVDCDSHSIGDIKRCHRYLAGISDAYNALKHSELLTKKVFCFTNSVNLAQLREIFVKFAWDNPEQLHLPAGTLVLAVFVKAFPCNE